MQPRETQTVAFLLILHTLKIILFFLFLSEFKASMNNTNDEIVQNIDTIEYNNMLQSIIIEVQKAQTNAIFAVNKQLILLYWFVGKMIHEKQKEYNWGSKFIETVAKDLRSKFPNMEGFSKSNIFYMKRFYESYLIFQTPSGKLQDLAIFNIPWSHNILLIIKVKNLEERLWYIEKTIENGWSYSILQTWIGSDLYHRQGKAITNFTKTLPLPTSDLAQQTFKDPYIFDFLTLNEKHTERDIEQGLLAHVENLLLELGAGFAFFGRQYNLKVDDQDFFIDLLFYHVKLKCFIVVELKAREFTPSDAGQLNFYLSAIDKQLKDPSDNPTIGLLLCKNKSNIIAECALRDMI